ncbi:hypothetical protein P7C73_g2025, partial [Tremellales sp. Uapishka_1]
MLSPLEPNRIHNLPVQVNYHVPSSSQIFTTLFSAHQQVYVHPTAGTSKHAHEDEAWGSIYLKTVVEGLIWARQVASPRLNPTLTTPMHSPELHPSHPDTPDLSLYILDPRETYLRRSRTSSSYPHYRSSPNPDASSPSSSITAPPAEVWTGKGLMSWALDEPGVGKNLITGRLVQSRDFATIPKPQDGLSAMEALMQAHSAGTDEIAWGIQVSVGMKSSVTSSIGIHPQVQHAMTLDASRNDKFRRSSIASDAGPSKESSRVPHSSQPIPPVPLKKSVEAPRPLSPTRLVKSRMAESKTRPTTIPAKRKLPSRDRSRLSSLDPNRRDSPASQAPPSSSSAFPTDIPAELYEKPESLTQEQAQRLLASPAFLNMLQHLTGTPINVPATKRSRDSSALGRDGGEKKAKAKAKAGPSVAVVDPPKKDKQEEYLCFNCGRTKSAVWRTKTMEDGQAVRVCNACGLYWNKLHVMRPPTMWTGIDDDVPCRPGKDKKVKNERPAARIDRSDSPSSTGFKRSLSLVAEKDAQRIASLRKSTLSHSFKPSPMTSPPRASASTSTTTRNSKWNATAHAGRSSPGGWKDSDTVYHHSDNFAPDEADESPNSTIKRLFPGQPQQSLDLPLSDDGEGNGNGNDWSTDLSAFFDVEGFSMPQPQTFGLSPPSMSEPTDFHRALSSGARKRRQSYPSSDAGDEDVLSQLFNRTSSVGLQSSSPPPFDFSQLPPSSPPMIPHSALLLSSPDDQDHGFSPEDKETPQTQAQQQTMSFEELEAIWNKLGSAGEVNSTLDSTDATENVLGGEGQDDLFKLLNENFGMAG